MRGPQRRTTQKDQVAGRGDYVELTRGRKHWENRALEDRAGICEGKEELGTGASSLILTTYTRQLTQTASWPT